MTFLIRRQTQAHFLKKHFRDINICNSKCFCRVALTKVCLCVFMCNSSFYPRVPQQHFHMAM
uniref:Putative ovule protein n=1 Tax=Solanum chacoense TaxID=4108 RepID=A0A0V0GQZ0_SOLCH